MGKGKDDDMAGLSDEERKALAEPEDGADDAGAGDDDVVDEPSGAALEGEGAAKKKDDDKGGEDGKDGKAAADDAGKDDAKGKGGKDTATAADKGKGDGGGDDDAAAAAAAAAKPEVIPPLRVPQLEAKNVPEDLDGKIKAANDALDALDAKLEADEIDSKTYARELRKLNDERNDLVGLKREVERVADHNKAALDQAWATAQDGFYDDNPDFRASKVLAGALGAALKDLYAKPEYKNADFRFMLNKAAAEVNREMGRTSAKDDGKGEGAGKKKDEAKPRTPAAAAAERRVDQARKDVTKVPKTTAEAGQAGTGDDTGGGEFDHLDGLNGIELEEELAKMTPSKAQRYLEGA